MKRGHLAILAIAVVVTALLVARFQVARRARVSLASAVRSSLSVNGQMAPDFGLESLDGKTVHLSDYRGKAVLLNFWATWCVPCKFEMPWFEQLQKQYGPQGLPVLGIAMDDADNADIAEFAKNLGVDYPILLGKESLGEAYGGVQFLPATFYVGRDGKVVDKVFGLKGGTRLKTTSGKLLAAGNNAVSQLVQAELPTVRPASAPLLRALPSWQLVTLAALVLWLYGPTLTHLIQQWWHDPNFSHGFFVPAFSAFVVWQERARLAQISLRPSWTGVGIVALALAVLVIGQTGAELFLARFSLLLLLSGLIALFLGWSYFRALLFPMAFLVLMIPIPTIVFNQITFPALDIVVPPSSQECQPGTGSLWRSRSNSFSRPSIWE